MSDEAEFVDCDGDSHIVADVDVAVPNDSESPIFVVC